MNWIVMPVIDCLEYTLNAVADCLAQSIPTKVLIINNGSSPANRQALEQLAENEPRVLVWSHDPPLPSLSATWNRALDFVWSLGGEHAWVINNDVRLHPRTYELLLGALNATESLFVTAVGVTAEQFCPTEEHPLYIYDYAKREITAKGGPDFSCFLISKACHVAGRFDEDFQPAYCEDLDYHRRMMLGGRADKIFSVNVPFLHYASRTINSQTPEAQRAFQRRVQRSYDHYEAKWGGRPNKERFWVPFALAVPFDHPKYLDGLIGQEPTTPALQAFFKAQETAALRPPRIPVEHGPEDFSGGTDA